MPTRVAIYRPAVAAIAFLLLLSLPLSVSAGIQELRFDRLSIEDGLSQSSVTAMLFDNQGWLWVGTEDGLNRYDGYGFKIYRHDPKDPASLGSGYVLAIFEDSAGTLWVGTEGSGLNRFDQERGTFDHFRHNPVDPDSLVDDRIQTILEDSRGRLWVGTYDGISRLDADRAHFTTYSAGASNRHGLTSDVIWTLMEDRAGTVWIGSVDGLYRYVESDDRFLRYSHDPNDPGSLGGNWVTNIFEDSSGRIWIGTIRGPAGLNRWDPDESRFVRYAHDPTDPDSIGSTDVYMIVEDPGSPGTLWMGTRTAGLVRFDTASGTFCSYLHDPARPTSVSNDRVSTVVFDNSGTLWAGTYDAGLNRLHRRHDQWVHYTQDPSDSNSLPNSYVRSIAEDESGTLWIGTYDGGLARLGPDRDRFIAYQHDPDDPTSLSWNEVRNVYVDGTGTVWAATYYGGLNRLETRSGTFTRFVRDPTDTTSLSDNRVMAVQEDGRGTLWVGTENGLNRFDRSTETFHRYRHDPTDASSLASNRIYALYADRQGDLWVATLGGGLDRYDLALDGFVHHRHDPSNPLSLPNDTVLAVAEDSRRRLWVGTLGGGLARLDRERQTFTRYTTDDGLPNNVIHGIVEDDEGVLWLSTNDGLARFEPDSGQVRTYTVGDGLLSNEFSAKAYTRTSRGELAFGSILGLTLFSPSALVDNQLPPPVVITELKRFGEPVVPGPESLLESSIEETRNLVLSHRDRVISFEFAALDFVAPQKNQYAYRLEGFDQEWRHVESSHRFASYTNLDPGRYTFRVRASNSDGIWNEEGASIEVRVLPPPWRTWWAYCVYALIIGAVLLIERRRAVNRIRLEGEVELERLETDKLKEVDQLKSKFFANISHEFRTPLALLLGPLDELIEKSADPEESARLRLMQRNAQRLHRLVNQLLDLSRLEGGSLALQPQPGDLVDFARGLTMAFESLAERQNIAFDFRSDRESLYVQFDAERVEVMVVNLISNAFKFTPEGGRIEVTLASDTDRQPEDTDPVEVTLTVRDTGIGIPNEFQSRVFDRFYQVDSSETREQEGTGIGLALVKELAQLHHGEATLESRSGRGTAFRLRLRFEPASTEAVASSHETVATTLALVSSEAGEAKAKSDPDRRTYRAGEDETIVLLVEDNADLRAFIRTRFDSSCRLLEAANGSEGFERAVETVPDLIISDVMMPEMGGYELCKKLKTDVRTSHVPVILLTAKAGREEKIEGLELGADEYLTKPFDSEELLVRARNLIEQRRRLRRSFSSAVVLRPRELGVGSLDQDFLEKALASVETHLEDEEFSVEMLASELYLSRSQLHRKIKALTNQTPTMFIRSIRLERSAQLLARNSASIGEIAYQVGFSSQAYFTKCFRDHFACTPSEYSSRLVADNRNTT